MAPIKKKKTDNIKCEENSCPIGKLLNLISGPWTTYILWLIKSNGPQRFGELRKSMATISAKILTERLRMLEKEGIINRHQEDTVPLKVTYSLTKRGKDLGKMLDEINSLAEKWFDSKSEEKSK